MPATAPTGRGPTRMNHSEIVSFLWGVADLIRDTFRRGRYQDVILPLTVLRRLDCVLAATKAKVLARQAQLRDGGLDNLDQELRITAGLAFYNTSLYDFDKLIGYRRQSAQLYRWLQRKYAASHRAVRFRQRDQPARRGRASIQSAAAFQGCRSAPRQGR